MKTTLYLIGFLFGLNVMAQSALYNADEGKIWVHGALDEIEKGLGIHTDRLINNGSFGHDGGMIGFYGNNGQIVSGDSIPVFNNVEIINPSGVFLETTIYAEGSTHFMDGDFITPRPQRDIYYNFLRQAGYNGETDLTKIDGYAAITGQQNFVFPVGDATQLRPLTLNSTRVNALAKCAYYRENPANSPSLGQNFDPNSKPRTIGAISGSEFWDLEGSVSSSIQIGWNANSNMSALTDDVNTLIPVGWSIQGQSWVNLGAAAIEGTIDQGFLVSDTFTPNDYAVITFATVATPEEMLKLGNYLVTPNGDGVNDFLLIEELELSQDHMIRIFDRNGIKVYEEKNYVDGFTGFANTNNMVVQRNAGLPNGIYFYIVDMLDLKLSFQGFLYLEK